MYNSLVHSRQPLKAKRSGADFVDIIIWQRNRVNTTRPYFCLYALLLAVRRNRAGHARRRALTAAVDVRHKALVRRVHLPQSCKDFLCAGVEEC